MTRPFVVCIVGKKKSGKTATTVGLVRELVSRGHLVGTAKHGHDFELDREGKDSWRHRHEGGAVTTVLSGPEGFAVTGDWSGEEAPLEALVGGYLRHVDVVVAEGHKSSGYPRIEVYRRAAHEHPLYGVEPAGGAYLAILTDVPDFAAGVPVIDVDDPDRFRLLADLVERHLEGEDA